MLSITKTYRLTPVGFECNLHATGTLCQQSHCILTPEDEHRVIDNIVFSASIMSKYSVWLTVTH